MFRIADLFDRLVILNTNSLPDGDGTDAARFPSTILFNKFQIWNAPFQAFRGLVNIMRYGIPLTAMMYALGSYNIFEYMVANGIGSSSILTWLH